MNESKPNAENQQNGRRFDPELLKKGLRCDLASTRCSNAPQMSAFNKRNFMPSNYRRQHIVPQQMIRRFTNEHGKLLELYKPTLSIGTRLRSPRTILFRDYYYDDRIASFDEEVLKPIEQKFARHYPEIAEKPWQNKVWPGEVGAAFVDWVAALLCRTGLLVAMNKILFREENPLLAIAYNNNPALGNNIIRSQMFEQYQDFLSRPLWKWQCRIFPAESESNLVITDNPVCRVLGFGKAAGTLMVPLSKRRILFGGKSGMVQNCGGLSIRDINFSLAAWAERHIYAADKKTLKDVVTDLCGEGIITGPPEVLDAARKPSLGLPERIMVNPAPEGIILDEFWKNLKDSFGPSIFDSGKIKSDKGD